MFPTVTSSYELFSTFHLSFIFPPCPNSPQWSKSSSLSGLHDHTQTHHTRHDSSGRVISPSQRPLPDNTPLSQQANIHAPGEIRTHNPSQRSAADPRLRPLGHWDGLWSLLDALVFSPDCSTVSAVVLTASLSANYQ